MTPHCWVNTGLSGFGLSGWNCSACGCLVHSSRKPTSDGASVVTWSGGRRRLGYAGLSDCDAELVRRVLKS